MTATRRRKRRRKRNVVDLKRFVLCTVTLVLLAFVMLTVFNSPYFAVKHIRVIGNKLVPAKQIMTTMKPFEGGNIFLTKERAISRLMKQNPIVASAHIHRRLPRTIIVHVFERKAHFVLNTGTAMYVVDPGGAPFRIITTPDPKLPMVICGIPGRIVLGRPLSSPGFSSARECLLLSQSKKIPEVSKITVDQSGCLCLNVRDKFQVKLGRPEGLPDKFDVVQRVLKQVPDFYERGLYIDVTCPGEPALKYAE